MRKPSRHHKSIHKKKGSNPPFLDLVFQLYVDFFKTRSLLGPLRNPVGANMGPKIAQVAPKILKHLVHAPPLGRLVQHIDLLMRFGRPLDNFWCPFNTLLIPMQDIKWLFAARFCQYLAKKWLPPN